MTKTTTQSEKAVGRRKTASARVRLLPGSGNIIVNNKKLEEYFPHGLSQQAIMAPLVTTSKEKTFDISIKVVGGGKVGQAQAVQHGIARALIRWDEALKPALKAEGFLTRDSRAKERKKYGLRKARRAHQWRKR